MDDILSIGLQIASTVLIVLVFSFFGAAAYDYIKDNAKVPTCRLDGIKVGRWYEIPLLNGEYRYEGIEVTSEGEVDLQFAE